MDEIYELISDLQEDLQSLETLDSTSQKELFDIYKFNARCDVKELASLVKGITLNQILEHSKKLKN